MKYLPVFMALLSVIIVSCSPEVKRVDSGRVVYAIDYPRNKDNFMLYGILPKEMILDFENGMMKSTISKAILTNELYVDCNKNSVNAYFQYAEEKLSVKLMKKDISEMIGDQKKYKVEFTHERDTMAGFNVKKAIATAIADPKDVIELWYTDEIGLKNSNWYNPFKKVKGFLLAYSIDRYGLRMEFRAKRFEGKEIGRADLKPKSDGENVSYNEYNKKLENLFSTFD